MERLPGILALLVLLHLGTALPAAGSEGWPLAGGKVPAWLKILYTLFLGVLIPVYWYHYGPANFLWFSDIALLVTWAALWLENRFLASTQAVAVTALELLWLVDFLVRLTAGVHMVGLSTYMFKPEIPLFVRGLSLFHVWLPFLLLGLVWRLGYDPRAWLAQSVTAVVVLLGCYFFTDPSENINWVFGPGEKPQSWMPSWVYLILVLGFFPVCVYLPTHFLLQWAFPWPGVKPVGVDELSS